MYTSITQIMAIVFLALPIVSAFEGAAPTDLERRYVGSNAVMASIIARNPDLLPSRDLSLRHHTEAQIAAKKAKASVRDVDAEVEAREAHHKSTKREPHHTEAQIAAKKAKASN
ncbi:uncharacterized protein PAC_10904 [Phialocephala subalpina]|uniref:Uncharacterized protein n=1 Tax=Phialocephala subalpina TaxID=576137 RepID=A0A1L7X7L2_9HELO|nr:uncharacterized protein PAC_10904 [Phialocephala subalpina]